MNEEEIIQKAGNKEYILKAVKESRKELRICKRRIKR